MLIGVRFTFVGQGLPAAVVALVPRRRQTTAIVQTSPPSFNTSAGGSWNDAFTFIMESRGRTSCVWHGLEWPMMPSLHKSPTVMGLAVS